MTTTTLTTTLAVFNDLLGMKTSSIGVCVGTLRTVVSLTFWEFQTFLEVDLLRQKTSNQGEPEVGIVSVSYFVIMT